MDHGYVVSVGSTKLGLEEGMGRHDRGQTFYTNQQHNAVHWIR